MDNKIKFDQHKKWNLYGYGATRYYVGLDVGTEVTKKDFFTDYTKKPSTDKKHTRIIRRLDPWVTFSRMVSQDYTLAEMADANTKSQGVTRSCTPNPKTLDIEPG